MLTPNCMLTPYGPILIVDIKKNGYLISEISAFIPNYVVLHFNYRPTVRDAVYSGTPGDTRFLYEGTGSSDTASPIANT